MKLRFLIPIFAAVLAVKSFATDNASGFKIISVEKSSIFDGLGFKAGDAILSINNKKFSTLTSSQELVDALGKSERGQIRSLRSGKEKILKFKVR